MERSIDQILTLRNYAYKHPSFKTIFEWEDIIAEKLKLHLSYDKIWYHKFYRRIEMYGLTELFHKLHKRNSKLRLYFLMDAPIIPSCMLDKNTIPVIIDFWLNTDQLESFYKCCKDCPLVLISSAEVYEYLRSNNCPLPIEHWPLSLPDTVEIRNSEKIFDFCFIGRKDPFFVDMVDRYSTEHLDFEYVINSDGINNREYHTNKGLFVEKDTGRQSYLNIIRKSKICVYSTPGMDKAKKESNTFNQVTPRLMELIAGGCYVLGHYPDNADTRFYNLKTVVPAVTNYAQFCKYMDYYRIQPARDIEECRHFLSAHNTSNRVELLKCILRKYNIKEIK